MSVAAEAVAFLGTEGVIMTSAAAVLGYRLLARASVTTARAAGTGARNGTKTTTTAPDTATAPAPPPDGGEAP